ncbi:MAG: tyrosine recombinase XerC [Magnetococcales bacterium]|nr:tyrosine recombinase XerC [Magnetococcales bacterium]
MIPDLPHAEGFWHHLESERRLSPNTVTAYLRDLERFADYWRSRHPERRMEDGDLSKLEVRDFRGFLALCQREGLSRATLQRRMASLRAWFRYMEREGWVEKNPPVLVSTPKLPKRLPRAPTEEETAHLIDKAEVTASKSRIRPRQSWVVLRDAAVLELLYGSGLRVGELCGLDRVDVDLDAGDVRVLGKGGKERHTPLGRLARTAIGDYVQAMEARSGEEMASDQPLFTGVRGGRLNPRAVQRLLRDLRRQLGLPEKVTPHALRHAFATHLLQSGADLRSIQEMMGHASLSTTQRYTHLDFMGLAKVYDAAHPRAHRRGARRREMAA